MAGLCAPLSTLRRYPHGHQRMTRGRCGSLLLHRDGLAPSTPCRSPGALRTSPREADNFRAGWHVSKVLGAASTPRAIGSLLNHSLRDPARPITRLGAALWLAATGASAPACASGRQSAVVEALISWAAGSARKPWQ